jgi:hypothetical protein
VLSAEAVAERGDLGQVNADELTCVDVDEQGAGPLAIRELIVGLFAVDQDLLDDAGVCKELDRPVDRGFRDAKAGGAHVAEELLGLKDIAASNDRVEDVRALSGVLETGLLERSSEDGAERLDDLER